jgi:hypothetical protein
VLPEAPRRYPRDGELRLNQIQAWWVVFLA